MPALILSLQASPCLDRENNFFLNIWELFQYSSTFFRLYKGLACQKNSNIFATTKKFAKLFLSAHSSYSEQVAPFKQKNELKKNLVALPLLKGILFLSIFYLYQNRSTVWCKNRICFNVECFFLYSLHANKKSSRLFS